MAKQPAEPEAAEAQSQPPQAEEPVQSIENDDNGDRKDDAPGDGEPSQAQDAAGEITEDQWRSMMDVVMAIYEYREEDGHDPSRLFQRSVNKRNVPDYYEIIKEPMALSILKQKINKREYKTFAEFVRDCALIPHNAQTYNRPESQAYKDALVIKEVFINEFKKLVDEGIITAEVAELPDLGEIPEADPLPPEDEEEEDDDEDEDDEDADDSDDGGGRRRRRRGARSSAAKKDESQNDPELRKKRGRPPRVDTPMEARIKAILKGIRKPKDSSGQLKIRHFERLPDKAMYPDYYMEIKEPMAIDLIKRKSKRKKYNSVDHFMRDIDLMFNNAKQYNQPDSQLYKDAVDLQAEAHRLAEQEKKKPDSEYLMEDGRLPLPEGIYHNGELWKVGDWVHIQNPNDVTKPIVAQIYRTWQDAEGDKWVNACWYYRPEQTVHHYEKHFYPNEVVKTGQYRDHRIEEVVDRCFVMFFTRYNRGRPRGFPPDKEVYVCEARYNEEKHKLNKIKTWASCLPDEVRDKDYEMDLFDVPRKIKKVPSPIKHLLKPDAKETDELPKPTWGAEKAPPLVGAVHCRPRDENESPPPEPTPSPPPQPVPQPAVPSAPQQPPAMTRPPTTQSVDSETAAVAPAPPARSPAPPASAAASVPPTPNAPAAVPAQPYQQPQATPTPPVYQPPLQARAGNYAPQAAHPAAYQAAPLPPHQYATPQHPSYAPYAANRLHAPPPPVYNPNAPRPIEVFHLSDTANAAIPENIRKQFHCDDQGRVLFFSTPPLDLVPPAEKRLGHSLKYLAAKAAKEERRRAMEQEKRKAAEDEMDVEQPSKRPRTDEQKALAAEVENLTEKALNLLANQVAAGTDEFYKAVYGDKAEEAKMADRKERERQVLAEKLSEKTTAQITALSKKVTSNSLDLKRSGVYLADLN
ncbi:hypothetical protein VTN77DRAFT_9160 [Rasamsonia byssochlamydoides]|uniref:uncharacterized protein n=1 Tax=Rasamsonia byssochlamydoides TaxID=89139 RepID=UPI00374475D4